MIEKADKTGDAWWKHMESARTDWEMVASGESALVIIHPDDNSPTVPLLPQHQSDVTYPIVSNLRITDVKHPDAPILENLINVYKHATTTIRT